MTIQNMKIIKSPSDAQVDTLMALPLNKPVAALNLFYFNERAQYQEGDPEYGTPEADISGRDAFDRYSFIAGQVLSELGGRVEFSAPVAQMMIGPADAVWDVVAIMYFPTRKAFVDMLSDPNFKAASRHRLAALANHRMIHLDGQPFAS